MAKAKILRYNVCVPREDKTGKTFWNQIGAAFPAKDKAISLDLSAVPVGGKAMLFPVTEDKT